MSDWLVIAVALAISYVLGSIPTGLWLGKALRGIDIREHGSKNIGATNTLRVMGKVWGTAALLGDMLKGIFPVVLGMNLYYRAMHFAILALIAEGAERENFEQLVEQQVFPMEYLPLACGIAAILGHSFSIFLRFTGGKGVATSAGVFLALLPLPTLIAAVVFGVTVWRSRMVSLGSILAAITLSVAAFFVPASLVLRVIVVLVAALVIWKHRANIGRIARGEENKF